MRKKIIQLGRFNTIILITLFSILASVLLYVFIIYFLEEKILIIGIITSILIPLIIAPSISYYFIRLLFRVHYLEVKMREIATFDSLTKVMTREAFLTNIETLHRLMKENQSSLAILYFDIDNLKKINDTYGHALGDEVLRSLASIFKDNKRENDLLGRLGGDEFAFALPETNAKTAIDFADKIRNRVKNTILEYEDIQIQSTLSIGVTVFNTINQVDVDELIKQSDEALYIAKKSGKDCTVLARSSSPLV